MGVDSAAHVRPVGANAGVVEGQGRRGGDPPSGVGAVLRHDGPHEPESRVGAHAPARAGGARGAMSGVTAGDVDPGQLRRGPGSDVEDPIDASGVNGRPAVHPVTNDDRAGDVEISGGHIGAPGALAREPVVGMAVGEHHHVPSRMPVCGPNRFPKRAVLVLALARAGIVVPGHPIVLCLCRGRERAQQARGQRQRHKPGHNPLSQSSLHRLSSLTSREASPYLTEGRSAF